MTDALIHQWTGTALSCPTDSVTVTFTDTVGDVFQCGNASIEVLEGGSRLTVTADSSLDGATVVCTDAGGTVLVDVDINVIGKQKKVYVIILHSLYTAELGWHIYVRIKGKLIFHHSAISVCETWGLVA